MFTHLINLIAIYPVDSVVTIDQFDTWAIDRGLIEDPETSDKQSAAWAQLLKQRNALRIVLNRLAMHADVPDGLNISIDVFKHSESYKIIKQKERVIDLMSNLPYMLKDRFLSKHRMIKRLLKSTDYERLDPYEQMSLKMMEKEGDNLKNILAFILNQYSERCAILDGYMLTSDKNAEIIEIENEATSFKKITG